MEACVDKDMCIGCGLCPEVCSDIFKMDDDEKAVAAKGEVPALLINSAKDAEEQCPVNAITVK